MKIYLIPKDNTVRMTHTEKVRTSNSIFEIINDTFRNENILKLLQITSLMHYLKKT